MTKTLMAFLLLVLLGSRVEAQKLTTVIMPKSGHVYTLTESIPSALLDEVPKDGRARLYRWTQGVPKLLVDAPQDVTLTLAGFAVAADESGFVVAVAMPVSGVVRGERDKWKEIRLYGEDGTLQATFGPLRIFSQNLRFSWNPVRQAAPVVATDLDGFNYPLIHPRLSDTGLLADYSRGYVGNLFQVRTIIIVRDLKNGGGREIYEGVSEISISADGNLISAKSDGVNESPKAFVYDVKSQRRIDQVGGQDLIGGRFASDGNWLVTPTRVQSLRTGQVTEFASFQLVEGQAEALGDVLKLGAVSSEPNAAVVVRTDATDTETLLSLRQPRLVINARNAAPGSLLLLNADLGRDLKFQAGTTLPREVDGVRFLFGGSEVPIARLGMGSYVQIPWEAATGPGGPLYAIDKGSPFVSPPVGLDVRPVAPAYEESDLSVRIGPLTVCGSFECSPRGNLLKAFSADWQAITPDRPAAAGSILNLYARGFGPVAKAQVTGIAAPFGEVIPTASPVTCSLDGLAVKVEFAGAAPGLAGLYQLVLRLPDALPPNPGRLTDVLELSCEVGGEVARGWLVPQRN